MATLTLLREARYILTDVEKNNNKFWNIRLFSDQSCETEWGRVGEEGRAKRVPNTTEQEFQSRCQEKERKGYRPQKTVGGASSKTLVQERLREAALRDMGLDSEETIQLAQYLAEVNRHAILQATSMEYDSASGAFSTPLGLVTADGIAEARRLLTGISDFVVAEDYEAKGFASLLSEYLMLIPQNIGRARPNPRLLFPDPSAVQQQNEILEALEASLESSLPQTDACEPSGRVFEAKLTVLDNPMEEARLRWKFRGTRQKVHMSSNMRMKRVFRVAIDRMERDFESVAAERGNVWELWHGTKASNVLSILKHGFVIPPCNAAHVTGRMFGNGVYFSDQSTKSLNYAMGYWDGKTEKRCFMFVCSVAMGRVCHATEAGGDLPPEGYDSVFAKGGVAGVMNNEMIVYNTSAIRPLYLIEFVAE